ncbi:MAG: apolipoprotein N-acyltransferase [Deltaproteobacteria bacterium]|nr:apolipoprotein N-acyltransferase [Deltaproteobacteria bacterium]
MRKLAAAVLSGILLARAFPPHGVAPFAWIALLPLLLSLRGTGRAVFVRGFAAGATFYLLSMSWVMAMVRDYAGASRAVSVGAYLLLAAYLAAYTGLFALAMRRGTDRFGPAGLLLAPFLWVALEWANTILFTGFHWNPLSASQGHLPVLAGVARSAGSAGMSFLVVLANATLTLAVAPLIVAGGAVAARPDGRALVLAGALLALIPLSGFARPLPLPQGGAAARGLHLRLVNPAVAQDAKWTLSFQRKALSQLAALSRAGAGKPDLVLWPEAAVPFPFDENPFGAAAVGRLARSIGAGIMFGSPGRYGEGEGVLSTNSVFLVNRDGNLAGRYDKRRLVPFGEYVPLRPLLSAIPAVAAGPAATGELGPGDAAGPLQIGNIALGPLVCYEAIFSDLAAEAMAAGAEALVNLTNDAWLGTAGAAQHFAMARLRALESAAPLVRVANRGTSALIGADGVARCVLEGDAAGTVDCALELTGAPFAPAPLQPLFAPSCAVLSLAALLWPTARRRR